MFTEQLNIWTVRSKSPNFKIRKQDEPVETQDLHFEICNAFLKKTGQKLLQRQAEIIDESCKVLNRVSLSLKHTKKENFYFSTDDSQNTPDQQISLNSQEKVISRKSVTRRSQTNIQQALKQVQQSCRLSTFNILNALILQYHKLQSRSLNIQAKQHVINKKQEAADKYHQENVILKKKLEAEQAKNKIFGQQLLIIKTKNQNISKCVQEKVNAITMNQKIVDINQKVYKDIKAFLQDKQMHINSRLRKIQHIEESIMLRIQKILQQPIEYQTTLITPNPQKATNQIESTCQRCCQMLKKLKESILKYRLYLQHEAQQVQGFIHIQQQQVYNIQQVLRVINDLWNIYKFKRLRKSSTFLFIYLFFFYLYDAIEAPQDFVI